MHIDIDQLYFIDPKLRQLVAWLESRTGFQFTITSMYRINDTGPHGTMPLRAIDLRCREGQVGFALEMFINGSWQYDPDRPGKQCALFHDNGKGEHLHLQVHPNTVRKD